MAYFAASADTPDTLGKFAGQLGVDFPLLADPTRDVARAYGVVRGDRSFAARWTFYIGTDGRILDIDKTVSPATAGEAIVKRLAELGVGRRAARPGGR